MRYHFPSASLALICAAACNDIPTRPMSTEPLDAAMTKVVGSSFTMLSISAQSACGVEKKGQIYCWGLNNFGQLGDGTSDFFSPIPRAAASGT